MLKIFLVKAGNIPMVKDFEEIEEAFQEIGIKKDKNETYNTFETMLLNDGAEPYNGVGIIAHDQDKGRRKKNLLGLKGDFLILGMERLEPNTKSNPHMFQSLTEEQIKAIRKGLARAAIFGDM